MNENPQAAHFDALNSQYAAHYYDATAVAYRTEFILRPFIDEFGIDLDRKTIADVCCGDGWSTRILREMTTGSTFVGFDISQAACANYPRTTGGSEVHCYDITQPVPSTQRGRFDAAIVIGGFHHAANDLAAAARNVGALLRPGGHLLMMEPNSRYVLQVVRKLWYWLDRYFEHGSEAAINHRAFFASAADHFDWAAVKFFGGPAFYLIENSMVLRIPVRAKPSIARLAMPLERVWNRMPFGVAHPSFLAVWRKRADEVAHGFQNTLASHARKP